MRLRSFGERLAEHAAVRGEQTALDFLAEDGRETRLSWRALDDMVNRAARVLANLGASQGHVVGFALRNSPLHIALTLAIWRLGATTFNFDPKLPAHVAQTLLRHAGASICIHENETDGMIGCAVFEDAVMAQAATPLPNLVSCPGKILMSGGSTGMPKLMADDQPYLRSPGRSWGNVAPSLGFRPNQVQLMSASLSHNAGLTWAQNGLFEGQHLVLFEKFDAARVLTAIDRFKVEFVLTVPTMLVRMLDRLPASGAYLHSLAALYHTAGPCPPWLKERWMQILGPERVFEMYGSGENTGQTVISGQEWLLHRGSVGRGFETRIRIRDAAGTLLPSHEVGEVFMLPDDIQGRSRYIGPDAPAPRRDEEGYQSVGDAGWLDEDGYLYLAGRCDDAINTGGLTVHPERVEAELIRLDAVRDVVVFGVDSREWGQSVAALVVLKAGHLSTAPKDLIAACSGRLSPEEVPRIIEFRDALPRDGFGKIRRKALQLEFNETLRARGNIPSAAARSPEDFREGLSTA